jgi:preprotein translocase subunit YajC
MDPFLIIVVVALALFVFMQFRTAKKRRAEAAELQEKMLPGTEIMTNYGLYGTIVSIDDDTNIAIIETTPGTMLRIHRQTILKAVEDEVAAEDTEVSTGDDQVVETLPEDTAAPQFGERVEDETEDPARKGAKNDRE